MVIAASIYIPALGSNNIMLLGNTHTFFMHAVGRVFVCDVDLNSEELTSLFLVYRLNIISTFDCCCCINCDLK